MLVSLLSLFACSPPPAGTFETVELEAEAVDQVFTLTIFEPDAAEDGGQTLYLFDGDNWTPTVAKIVSDLADEGATPPRVVGIGYGDRPNKRARDLTPEGPGVPAGWGEVDAFTSFLADELVPWTEEAYPVASNPSARVVLGHSFGGAAAMHMVLRANETFAGAVVLSPSLTLGEGALFDLEAEVAATNEDLPARVHLGAGALEAHGLAGLTEAMGATLASRDYPSLAVQTQLVPGKVHTNVFRPSAEEGLRFVLEGP
ncbi:MAG: alpha/beta hydrolase [Proteobacteria bacterium]|nr:alpha/beta hydrolase [Pseudomonadota bacterium]